MPTLTHSRRAFLGTALTGAGLLCTATLPAAVVARSLTSTSDKGGTPASPPVTETRVMLGTFVTITIAQSSLTQAQDALGLAFAEVARLERVFSRYDSASPLSVLNAQGSLGDLPPELHSLLQQSIKIHHRTNQTFDPTVMPVVDVFKAHQNMRGRMHIPPAELAAARQLIGMQRVLLNDATVRFERAHMGISLDGIAKGYIVDAVSTLLLRHGLSNHLVNAGGDIVAHGEKATGHSWTVAVENPQGSSRRAAPYPETLPLRQAALATSGNYEIYYDASREHHHIINPASGSSPQRVSSVSVLAPTATEADALATALSVMAPHDALRFIDSLPQRECCILGQGLRLASRSWPG